ncbi:MAG: crossover junction endodeoxyribonuclease RuvC, partial [Chloroflexia bacterium]
MRVLGLDPGTARMGWGVIEGEEEPSLVAYGTLSTPAGRPLADRLYALFQALRELVSRYRPQA